MRPLNEIKLFLLDMDGTVYLGERLFPCTLPFLDRLSQKGIEYSFLTNNSSKSKAEYLEKLRRMGLPACASRLMTSGEAAVDYLKQFHGGEKVFLVGTESLRLSFLSAGIGLFGHDEAEIAVVGFDTELTYEKLNGLYHMVKAGKRYICTHPDLVCPTDSGAVPDIGATIAYIKALTKRDPDIIIGKPERGMIDAAARRFSVSIDDIAVVGDRLYTDIAMAVSVGATSVLVLSGETSAKDLEQSSVRPDYVMSDLSDITKALI